MANEQAPNYDPLVYGPLGADYINPRRADTSNFPTAFQHAPSDAVHAHLAQHELTEALDDGLVTPTYLYGSFDAIAQFGVSATTLGTHAGNLQPFPGVVAIEGTNPVQYIEGDA